MTNFGKSPAAIILTRILTERNDTKITKKVNRVYAQSMQVFNALDSAKGITLTRRLKFYFLNLTHVDIENKIKEQFDKDISKFLLNVIDCEYRQRVKSYQAFRLKEIREIREKAIVISKKFKLINQQKKNNEESI